MNRELQKLIQQDLSRIYDHKLTMKDRLFLPLEIKYLILWRKASWYRQKDLSEKKPGSRIRFLFYGMKLMQLTKKTQINIPAEVNAGPGLYLGHLGRVILHPDVTLGANVNLSTGVTIGQCNRGSKKGVPTIGSHVWIGTNAVIVGKITIGDDVLIAPGAYVNMDIPPHSIVIGNPAVIHPSDSATKDYINRPVSPEQ